VRLMRERRLTEVVRGLLGDSGWLGRERGKARLSCGVLAGRPTLLLLEESALSAVDDECHRTRGEVASGRFCGSCIAAMVLLRRRWGSGCIGGRVCVC
jgi:hypothetical protein